MGIVQPGQLERIDDAAMLELLSCTAEFIGQDWSIEVFEVVTNDPSTADEFVDFVGVMLEPGLLD